MPQCARVRPGLDTYNEDGQRENRVQGNERAGNTVVATAEGRDMARERGTEHVVKPMDGTVGETKSRGAVPADRVGVSPQAEARRRRRAPMQLALLEARPGASLQSVGWLPRSGCRLCFFGFAAGIAVWLGSLSAK